MVVSHSRPLAVAAVELAEQMVRGGEVRIAVAAGLDETTLGTDAVQIAAAIAQVDGPAGVVVLMDLGSAVLSAELALELLPDPATRDRVLLSPAPVVEGLVVAAVAAAGGADRDEVAAEAAAALLGKLSHLGATDAVVPAPPAVDPEPVGPLGGADVVRVVAVLTVLNEHGLHARPAARLVQELQGLDAEVRLRRAGSDDEPVPARSLSRVATLGARRGARLEVSASGPQAQEAVDRLLALAEQRFDEAEVVDPTGGAGDASPGPPQTDPGERRPATAPPSGSAAPAAPGIAVGPARRLIDVPVDLDALEANDTEADGTEADGTEAARWQRVAAAVAAVAGQVQQVRAVTLREIGAAEAQIFDAHLALLADEEVLADVRRSIAAGQSAPRAWSSTMAEVERRWAELDDEYLRERAADVRSVTEQVLRELVGAAAPQPSGQGVLVAADLTPAQTAALDPSLVTGVVLAAGSATSHAAILARGRDLPMVVGAGSAVLALAEGTLVALDGATGELHLDPSSDVLTRFDRLASERAARRREDLAAAEGPAVTRDGIRVHVLANVGSEADARAAAGAGADGAGLVRTELLFLDRSTPPDRAEQLQTYVAVATALAGRRVTLRTMDVGGDKPLAYLPMPAEANPFLGLRGLRLSLQRPDLLLEQLTAICEAARQGPVGVMFPMVSTVAELLQARRYLTDAAGPAGLPVGLTIGMMVEVPTAALKIASFLPHLDFVSIGTNDLTQYTMAAERGNASVAALSDPVDPGVLQLVDRVCRAAVGTDVQVAVCGEAASDELAVPLLVGLGVHELSVSPHAAPRVKAAVRTLHAGTCRELARRALDLADAAQVRALVTETMARLPHPDPSPASGSAD